MNLRILALAGLVGGITSSLTLGAQEAEAPPPTPEQREAELKKLHEMVESFGWTRQGMGDIGGMAQIAIPQGYRFTGAAGASKMLEFYGNPPSDRYLGLLATEDFREHSIIFEFDDIGYVKDDEKDSLNADALLATMRENQEYSNERRKEMGLDELEITGWAVPPRFNDQTKNLEWALILRSKQDGGSTINHNTRLLGRKGVMEVTLMCAPEELEGLLPSYQQILGGFAYQQGETYAEFREGDKMAKYGLTALVAGGAAVAAGKMGLFAKLAGFFGKLGKGIVVVILGIGVALKGLFSKLFGGRTPPEA